MPFTVLVAGWGARYLIENRRALLPGRARQLGPVLVVVGLLWMGAVFGVEIAVRVQMDARPLLIDFVRAPTQREERSDALLADLGHRGSLPVSIALQEVEIRYFLDKRFIVRSLDGRTDPVLLDFVDENQNIDHLGYIEKRGVDYILELPNYNRDPDAWSLERLWSLRSGGSRKYGNLTITHLAGKEEKPVFQVKKGP